MDEQTRLAFLGAVRDEETLLEFSSLDRTQARLLGEAIAASCAADDLPIAVAVHLGDQRIFHVAFEGTTAENDKWMDRKRNTVLRTGVSSFEIALTTRLAGLDSTELHNEEFAAASGAVPLRVAGDLIGTISLSGLVCSEEADHEAVMQGVAAYRGSLEGAAA